MIWIGIDPGEHTGVAVWDGKARRLIECATLPLHRALRLVGEYNDKAPARGLRVVFEDARQRRWLPRESSASEYRGKLMGAGAAKRDARIWEEYLTDLDVAFEALAPRAGMTKWDAAQWARVTGWKGRTSEHARDAALLVFGR